MGTRFMLSRWLGRIRTAGMLIGAVLLLGACTARGGGQLGAPLDGGPVSVFGDKATFGFTFTCAMEGDKPVIRGQLEYHDKAPSTVGGVGFPAIDLHGVVDPMFKAIDPMTGREITVNVTTCEAVAQVFPGSALFKGTYTPQELDPAIPDALERGQFTVQVFDQGEPGRSVGEITGDSFSIKLTGGRYNGYTRAGYIEGGSVQVSP